MNEFRFEYQHALRDLEQRTPKYLREEVFAHGDLTVKIYAVEALDDLDEDRATSALKDMLKLT